MPARDLGEGVVEVTVGASAPLAVPRPVPAAHAVEVQPPAPPVRVETERSGMGVTVDIPRTGGNRIVPQ